MINIKIENMKYLLILYSVICFLFFWVMYVFNAIMEDANTLWNEDGVNFSTMGYWRYKRKNYWHDKMRNCI
jgi:hypothetical protein